MVEKFIKFDGVDYSGDLCLVFYDVEFIIDLGVFHKGEKFDNVSFDLEKGVVANFDSGGVEVKKQAIILAVDSKDNRPEPIKFLAERTEAFIAWSLVLNFVGRRKASLTYMDQLRERLYVPQAFVLKQLETEDWHWEQYGKALDTIIGYSPPESYGSEIREGVRAYLSNVEFRREQ